MIAHTDKTKKFLKRLNELAEKKNFKIRAPNLAKEFEKYGITDLDLKRFQTIDTEIIDCILCATKTITRKNCVYQKPHALLTGSGL